MSKRFESISKVLVYFFNSKSTSLSLTTLKPRPPEIQLDSVLKSWGLLSGEYMNDGSIRSTKFAKFNQLFIIFFFTYYLMKFLLAMFIEDDSILLIYIGDLTIIFMDMSPRIFFNTFYSIVSLKSLLVSINYLVNEKTGRLSWLRITQLTKG